MNKKLQELNEILCTNPDIEKRLKQMKNGCHIDIGGFIHKFFGGLERGAIENGMHTIDESGKSRIIGESLFRHHKIIGHIPQFHDVLEFLGDEYFLNTYSIQRWIGPPYLLIKLKPGNLATQDEETLEKIMLLCKENLGNQN